MWKEIGIAVGFFFIGAISMLAWMVFFPWYSDRRG